MSHLLTIPYSIQYPVNNDGVNRLLEALLNIAHTILGNRLCAYYTLGSLAHGGFSPSVSDIDVAMIFEGSLTANDHDLINKITQKIQHSELLMRERLSIFWSSQQELQQPPPGNFGRFPAYDRRDFIEYAKLVWGTDIRDGSLKIPSQTDLDIEAVELALDKLNDPFVLSLLKDPVHLLDQTQIPPSKIILMPVRFLFTRFTGCVGSNSDAVDFYCQQYRDDNTACLVKEAIEWRNLETISVNIDTDRIKQLLPLIYLNFIDAYLEPIEQAKKHKLFWHLKKWHQTLKK
jgi:hypothetical protein